MHSTLAGWRTGDLALLQVVASEYHVPKTLFVSNCSSGQLAGREESSCDAPEAQFGRFCYLLCHLGTQLRCYWDA